MEDKGETGKIKKGRRKGRGKGVAYMQMTEGRGREEHGNRRRWMRVQIKR